VREFAAPPELKRQLDAFQLEVNDALQRLHALHPRRLRRTPPVSSDYLASFGEFVMLVPTGASFTVTLPAPASDNEGEMIGVVNDTALSTEVTVRPLAGTLSGHTSRVIDNTHERQFYMSDGQNYVLLVESD
jgi:hypothetical protein